LFGKIDDLEILTALVVYNSHTISGTIGRKAHSAQGSS